MTSILFKLNDQQMTAFGNDAYANFIERMSLRAAALLEGTPAAADARSLRSTITRLIEEAQAYGIFQEPDVERFIDVCVCYAELSSRPMPAWIDELLRDPVRPIPVRLDALEERLEFAAMPDRSDTVSQRG